jgi:hypothetical protein
MIKYKIFKNVGSMHIKMNWLVVDWISDPCQGVPLALLGWAENMRFGFIAPCIGHGFCLPKPATLSLKLLSVAGKAIFAASGDLAKEPKGLKGKIVFFKFQSHLAHVCLG